jgi:hypothetical protein
MSDYDGAKCLQCAHDNHDGCSRYTYPLGTFRCGCRVCARGAEDGGGE